MKRYYGERPVLIDTQTVDCLEMMFYQDYPIKLVDSPDKYDLKGNSINPLLDYKWDYQERLLNRNIPQSRSDDE